MRALNFFGWCIVGALIAAACGGESAGTGDDGPGAGETGNGEGGDSPGGTEGGGGADSGPSAGEPGNGEAGATSTGGRGGGSAGGPVGGGSVVGGRAATPTGGKGNPPVNGGVPGTGGLIGTAGDDGSGGECVALSTSSSTDSCNLELSCEDGYSYTSCFNQRTGTWSCECTNRTGRYQTYDITGVAGLAACQTVADVCMDTDISEIEGPEECVPQVESRATSYCELQHRCARSLAITDEVAATVTRQRYVSCSNFGDGRMDCYCGNGLNLQIEGQDGTQACDTLIDICEDPDIGLDGPVVCTPEGQSVGPGYCSSTQRCTQSLEVDGGMVGISVGSRAVNCSTADGGSICECYDQANYLRFFSELPPSTIATCNTFAESCTTVDELGLNGPISCAPSYQQGDVAYCSASIECSQAGTLGDEPIRAFGSIQAYCQPLNGVWSCTCSGGLESASVEVTADGGWAACTELIELCPDLVEVQIGQSGGIDKPLPL